MSDKSLIDLSAANTLPTRGDELVHIVTRFEYALKEIGYCWQRKKGDIELDWNTFANKSLTTAFFEKVRDEQIAPTILAKPPSKQVLRGTALDWEAGTPPTTVQDLMGAVRRVRNNLLHGGKSGDRDSDRNNVLVSEAIEVLLEALRSDSDLCRVFEGRW